MQHLYFLAKTLFLLPLLSGPGAGEVESGVHRPLPGLSVKIFPQLGDIIRTGELDVELIPHSYRGQTTELLRLK